MRKILLLALCILIINCTSDNDEVTNSNLPSLTTIAISNVSSTTATSGGNISDSGGENIIARGICWNTNGNPTINDNFTTNGLGVGEFSVDIDNLENETTYFVRAFATNSSGTSYGNELNFITLETENIYEGNDIFLATQEDVDEFGSNNYTIVNAGMKIGADGTTSTNNAITNLNALNSIKSVYRLEIYDNNSLENLNGLSNLEKIDTEFRLWRNNLISNLNALSNITNMKSFSLNGGNLITNIDGIVNITNLNEISISDIPLLTNIDIFTSIQNLNNLVTIYIGDNNALTNINGLNNITNVNHLYIVRNSVLSNLCGISALINNDNPTGVYSVSNNAYNPTKTDIMNGNCSN